MSRIMRELEREGRAARGPMPDPSMPPVPPPPVPPVGTGTDDPDDPVCRHGIKLSSACLGCGRWSMPTPPTPPAPPPLGGSDGWPFTIACRPRRAQWWHAHITDQQWH